MTNIELPLPTPKRPDSRSEDVAKVLQMAATGDPGITSFIDAVFGSGIGIGKTCSDLRQDFPDDPAIWLLSSHAAGIIQNPECRNFFLAKSIHCGLESHSGRTNLIAYLNSDDTWSDVDDYLYKATSKKSLTQFYMAKAKEYFAESNLETADLFCQYFSALQNPTLSQLNNIKSLREEAETSEFDSTLQTRQQSTFQRLNNMWSSKSITLHSDPLKQVSEYSKNRDRMQLSSLIIDAVKSSNSTKPVVLEIGCFMGSNLYLAWSDLPASQKNHTILIGIDPNQIALEKGRKAFPFIEFKDGAHSELTTGKLDLPDIFDVCILSRVFCVLLPNIAQDLLNYLYPRTKRLIIADDVFNFFGNKTLVRTPPDFYFIHNFQKQLRKANFREETLVMSEAPDRECNGFILVNGRI